MRHAIRRSFALVAPALAACIHLVGAAPVRCAVVFETDFESGLPAAFTAPGSQVEPVQGYAGLGPAGNQFGGGFLRYTLQGIVDTKLKLQGLPPHDTVDVGFLLALIDSWDGTELMRVSVDGAVLFSHWFQLATGDASSYVAPPGALLSSGVNLGFSNGGYHFRDRAYDLSLEPAFLGIPHTADTLEVKWFLGAVSGGAAAQWQGGGDESWAIDHVKVTTHASPVGVEGSDGPALALAAPVPNPATGSVLRLRFVLPGNAPATVELLDVRGRRLSSRQVGGLGAGSHEITLAAPGQPAPGVYLVRLSQGAEARTMRVVFAR